MGFTIRYCDGGPAEGHGSRRALAVGVVDQDHVGTHPVVGEDPDLVF